MTQRTAIFAQEFKWSQTLIPTVQQNWKKPLYIPKIIQKLSFEDLFPQPLDVVVSSGIAIFLAILLAAKSVEPWMILIMPKL